MKTVINTALRDGLRNAAKRVPAGRFVVKARPLGQRPGVQLDSIGDLLETLEGPGHL